MRTKSYIYSFTAEDGKRFYLKTHKGNVIKFTIQYETLIRGKWYPVVRYDTVHGYPHRDILDKRGKVVEKTDLSDMSYKDALNFAEKDINSNW